METIERVDVMREAMRRLRAHLGVRLQAVYALPGAPFEPEDGDESLHLVVAVENPDTERRSIVELLLGIERETGVGLFAYAVDERDELFDIAKASGVRL